MWYVSFHGGKEGKNNIHIYHDDGKPHKHEKLLPNENATQKLSELRSFVFSGKQLFVANGGKDFSEVMEYTMSDKDTCTFKQVYASTAISSMFHPYCIALDHSTGRLFVSNQDSNTVTCLTAAKTAAPIAPFLQKNYGDNFLQGTFVASANGNMPHTPSVTPVPQPQGLYSTDAKLSKLRIQHSVRGIAFHNGFLYVADEPSDSVKIYDGQTGALMSVLSGKNLVAPVQLLVEKEVLYIGSTGNSSVVTCKLPNGKPPKTNAPLDIFIDGIANHISGMCFDNKGNFYAANRLKKKIDRYNSAGLFIQTVVDHLPDEPEFILWADKKE